MNSIESYQAMLIDHKHPCFIVEYGTNTVLYSNSKMEKLLYPATDVVGAIYYNLVKDTNANHTNPPKLHWEDSTLTSQQITAFGKSFDVTYCKVQEGEQSFLVIIYKIVETEEEKSIHFFGARQISSLVIGNRCKIKALLQLLGEVYHADGSFVHVAEHSKKTITQYESWISPDSTSEINHMVAKVDEVAGYDGLTTWAKARDEDGIWDCDINRKDSPNYVLDKLALGLFQRQNMVLCGINDDDGELKVVVSLGDCDNLLKKHELLKDVTHRIYELLEL